MDAFSVDSIPLNWRKKIFFIHFIHYLSSFVICSFCFHILSPSRTQHIAACVRMNWLKIQMRNCELLLPLPLPPMMTKDWLWLWLLYTCVYTYNFKLCYNSASISRQWRRAPSLQPQQQQQIVDIKKKIKY